MLMTPRVVDLFHGDVLACDTRSVSATDAFKMIRGGGIWGIIHKATQGIGYDDPQYMHRTLAARSVGLLVGAYHFNTGDTVNGQLNHFFDAALPDENTLMALDFEDNRASQMTLSEAVEFLQLGDERLGRPLWLYSGNRIKELIVDQSKEVRQTFAKRPFWLCEYGLQAKMADANGKPLPWAKPTLWQFTGDGIGPQPHSISGVITRGIDLNSFDGSIADLTAAWTGRTADVESKVA